MSIQKALLIELAREKDNTYKIIERLKDEDFNYKPHPKSMSLGELANHIVELHNWVKYAFTKDTFDFHTDYTPSNFTSINDLLNVLNQGFEENKKLVEALDEEKYLSVWTLKAGNKIIAELPRAGALRFIITNHLIHHRGQLTVYMRLLNIPIPGIYGPSGDEK